MSVLLLSGFLRRRITTHAAPLLLAAILGAPLLIATKARATDGETTPAASPTSVSQTSASQTAAPQNASAPACKAGEDVLGTSRTIVLDPTEHTRIGTMQYRETLPLKDREVLLTFDDGPLPPYTNRVLDALDAECVKATFFIVGRMAKAYPAQVRDIQARGHTLAAHSLSHPFAFNRLNDERMASEIDDGIGFISAAIGGAKISPFFRIPGLAKGDRVEAALESRGLMIWSADFPADDWRHISASEVHRRAIQRLEAKGKGVLLLHDIQPSTALALPAMLRDLKQRGFRIVHAVAASADNAKTVTRPEDWRMRPQMASLGVHVSARAKWPSVKTLQVTQIGDMPTPAISPDEMQVLARAPSEAESVVWPQPAASLASIEADLLPAPASPNHEELASLFARFEATKPRKSASKNANLARRAKAAAQVESEPASIAEKPALRGSQDVHKRQPQKRRAPNLAPGFASKDSHASTSPLPGSWPVSAMQMFAN